MMFNRSLVLLMGLGASTVVGAGVQAPVQYILETKIYKSTATIDAKVKRVQVTDAAIAAFKDMKLVASPMLRTLSESTATSAVTFDDCTVKVEFLPNRDADSGADWLSVKMVTEYGKNVKTKPIEAKTKLPPNKVLVLVPNTAPKSNESYYIVIRMKVVPEDPVPQPTP